MRFGLLLALLVLVRPAAALAGATSPALVLGAASGEGSPGGHTVLLEGAFEFDNALQVGYPLQAVVFQKTRFVRYPIAGPPVTGTSPTLNDGVLTDAELAAFLGDGAPTPAAIRIVTVAPSSLRVTLPAQFRSGAATALLFTILPEGSVLSNQIDFVLP